MWACSAWQSHKGLPRIHHSPPNCTKKFKIFPGKAPDLPDKSRDTPLSCSLPMHPWCARGYLSPSCSKNLTGLDTNTTGKSKCREQLRLWVFIRVQNWSWILFCGIGKTRSLTKFNDFRFIKKPGGPILAFICMYLWPKVVNLKSWSKTLYELAKSWVFYASFWVHDHHSM